MTTKSGICLISVPKSGTMFLSRYLEKIAGSPVIFGLQGLNAHALRQQLDEGCHPEIRSKLSTNSPSLEVMTRRFSLMLERNRRGKQDGERLIYSDHGLDSFLRFLINPRMDEIQSPQKIVDWANERNLATVFLYRDIRAVSNSLAHFLASNKSFLMSLESMESAANLVTRYYAPVLAEQMRVWKAHSAAADVLCVSYEELMQDTAHWIQAICSAGGMPCAATGIVDAPENYRSWTYRSNGTSWSSTFSEVQRDMLNAIASKA